MQMVPSKGIYSHHLMEMADCKAIGAYNIEADKP